jgi:hypothetical protein
MANLSNASSGYQDVNTLDTAIDRRYREFQDFFPDRRAINDPLVTGYNYIFFTSPDLSLTQQNFSGASNSDTGLLLSKNQSFLKLPGGGDSIYNDNIIQMLSGNSGTFMKPFTNRATSYPANSDQLGTLDYAETWTHHKMTLGTTTRDTKIAGNFNMSFLEDGDLTMCKSIKLWMDYIEAIFYGDAISAYATLEDLDNAKNGFIDYYSSAYMFATKPDGRTLSYWCKYTGLYPTSVPWDVFHTNDSSPNVVSEVSIDFQFVYKEDMSVAALRDFNLLGQENKALLINPTGSFYDDNSVDIGGSNSSPNITKSIDNLGNPVYTLHFADFHDEATSGGYNEN